MGARPQNTRTENNITGFKRSGFLITFELHSENIWRYEFYYTLVCLHLQAIAADGTCFQKTGIGHLWIMVKANTAPRGFREKTFSMEEYIMKKFVFVLLAVLLVSLPVLGQSDELRNLTDTQLRSLFESVKAEITRRGLDAVEMTLQEGKYIIGRDIPAGSYRITCLSTEGESLNNMYNSLGSAYDNLDSSSGTNWGSLFGALGGMMQELSELEVEILGSYGDVLNRVTLKKDASADITLSEGTALQISEGTAKLISK